MADSTMVICKFHHRRVHRASFLGNLNTYPTRDNCWNVCGICHSRNSIRVHRVRLAVKKKIDPKFAQTPHPPHKVKTAVVQAVVKGNFPVLTTPGSHYRMDVAGCSCILLLTASNQLQIFSASFITISAVTCLLCPEPNS